MTDLLAPSTFPERLIQLAETIAEENGITGADLFEAIQTARNRNVSLQVKPATEPLYTLVCSTPLWESIVRISKSGVAANLKNRMNWDISRCPTFEVFIERATKQNADEIVIFQKLVTTEDFNDFMNTFLSDYTGARENYDRSNTSARSGTSPELRIVERI